MGGGQLPSGTVTFLFTDVERSTETVAELGDERYADVQEEHRKLLRESFVEHSGVEVGTEGDAFFIAFGRAGDAINAALAGQRALEGHPLRVRMGVHTGEALLRDGDYVGHDVHKAKRVSDAGHGGQILLSQATAELVRDSVELVDLGPHRLKDLGEPQRIFQVGTEGFPALRTLDATAHNLPVQLTSFVGRERELEEIAQLLTNHRLVTLTGVGGCGKTRLAQQVGAEVLHEFPDGVFFCDLSRLSDEESLAPAVARTLGILLATEQAGTTPAVEGIETFLRRKTALLILDNCEHLIGAVAELTEDLLKSSPDLKVLATSREALDVAGEHTWPIPSLAATSEAVQLFVDRAAAVRGEFELTDSNRTEIEAICERLDGIPLAIELAAAQIGHLGPRQIAERLDKRFMILTGGRRRVQRQQTLQAAMDWSWDLLDERDQTLLRRMSVFQGGCTLEAAEAVCGDGLDVFSGLRSLVAKSLVIAEQIEGSVRYRLLETVRLYAEDKQAESAENEEIRTRHRDHYLAWAEAIPLERTLWGEIFIGSELLPEVDNIRAALRWCESRGEFELMARLLTSTRRLWLYHHTELPRWFTPALRAELTDQLRGRLLVIGDPSGTVITGGPERGIARVDEAIRLLSGTDDAWLLSAQWLRAQWTCVVGIMRRDESMLEDALQRAAHCIGDGRRLSPFWEAIGHYAHASILQMRLRHREAADELAECFRLIPSDSPVGAPLVLFDAFRAARHVLGDAWPVEYDELIRVGFRGRERLVHPILVSTALEREEAGDHEGADAFLTELLSFARDRASSLYFSLPFTYTGVIAALRGDHERAARLLSAAISQGMIITSGGWAIYRHWVPKVREAIGPDRARVLREEGRTTPVDRMIEYALEGHRG